VKYPEQPERITPVEGVVFDKDPLVPLNRVCSDV
jgi:hypothetical protein